VNGDFFGGQGAALDVVQGDTAKVRDLAVGFGSLRTVRAETAADVPLIHADLTLVDGVVSGTIRNDSTVILEAPAVVLGGSVVVLPDIAPGATGKVDLRVTSTPQGTALSDKVVGQVFFNDAVVSNERQRRNQTRHRIIDQLTYDPMFGNLPGLPSDVPVVLAWGHDPILDVEIAGQKPARAANVLYYIPVGMQIRGTTQFGTDLMRSTVLSADAGFFSRDPYSMSFGKGTVTVAYRPIPFEGTFTPTKVLLGMGFGGGDAIGGGGVVIAPLPPQQPCPSDSCAAPSSDPNAQFDGLPETEVLDRTTGEWLRLPHLNGGNVYELKEPTRYVDPATGTIQIRFVNDRVDSVGISFNVALEGKVE